jgi:hypothetical protein
MRKDDNLRDLVVEHARGAHGGTVHGALHVPQAGIGTQFAHSIQRCLCGTLQWGK